MAKDNTQYIFNGKAFGKGRLVLAVVNKYVNDHNPSYDQLKSVFNDSTQGPRGTVIDENGYQDRLKKSEHTLKEYFTNDTISLINGNTIYVSNQWGITNIDGFVIKAKELGYDIKTTSENPNPIFKKYIKYKASPSDGLKRWWQSFSERCNQFKTNINTHLDDEFLKTFWLSPNNGISSVKPGFISEEEYHSLKSELPAITSDIEKDPSPEQLDNVLKWADEAKKKGQFNSVKRGVIHRVFVAAAPEKYCTILNKGNLKRFITKLNSLYDFDISTNGNWAELNASLMRVIRKQGLQEEDDIIVNTFTYNLYENLLNVVDNVDVRTIDTPVSSNNSVESNNTLNKIYYGPPGTGKTYNTINGALQIIDNDFYMKNLQDRSALKNKFDEYVKNERIGFVTFHQSFSYEDFVEGLRAEADDEGNIRYFVQDGIFKQLCEKATQGDFSSSIDEAIQQLIEKMEEDSVHLQTSSGKGFTMTYRGGRTFRVKPDSSDKSSDYPASIENIKKVFRGGSLKDVYNPSYVLSILEHLKSDYGISDDSVTDRPREPVVLIIDEINRGNTANIFGELITLTEPSKRAGAEEALSVILPYSKERFSVPDNLYIIGTMNTADRSLALIDTALRRRFQFEEMLAQPELLSEININGVDVQQLLTVVNKRIALLYDREHTLGHSFFLSLNENSTIQDLRGIFEGQVLPLLEEYFFEDWEKIRQVLGDHLKPKELQLIKPYIDENEITMLLGDSNTNMLNSLYYRDQTALSNPQAYIAIYERV